MILELTDSFNLHREAVVIPLATAEAGSADVLEDGRLRIVCPRSGSFEGWLAELRERLQQMNLSKLRR